MHYSFRASLVLVEIIWLAAAYTDAAETSPAIDKQESAAWSSRLALSYAKVSTLLGTGTVIDDSHTRTSHLSQQFLLYPQFETLEQQSIRLLWTMECLYTDRSVRFPFCDPVNPELNFTKIYIGGTFCFPTRKGRAFRRCGGPEEIY